MEQLNLCKIFKALANEQRLRLFQMLYEGIEEDELLNQAKKAECCKVISKAFTLASQHFSLSRSTLSHHFKELQNAGLIHCERKGQSFDCQVNPEALEMVRNFLK